MMIHTTVQALGQARLADMHDQARRDALVRAARRARRGRRQRFRATPGRANLAANDLCRQTRRVIRDG